MISVAIGKDDYLEIQLRSRLQEGVIWLRIQYSTSI
jgi:hypothetical protein